MCIILLQRINHLPRMGRNTQVPLLGQLGQDDHLLGYWRPKGHHIRPGRPQGPSARDHIGAVCA